MHVAKLEEKKNELWCLAFCHLRPMQPQSSSTGLALLDPKKIRFKKRSVHLGNMAFKSASSGCLCNQMENFDADFMLSGL
jgi:hypothetical protein